MMRRAIVIATLILALAGMAVADEGMWLFNHPPSAKIKAKYGFQVTGHQLHQECAGPEGPAYSVKWIRSTLGNQRQL